MERAFVGRVHLELKDYSADIFLDGSSTPVIREIDQDAGTDMLEAGALHRVVLRARESSGTISVFEGAHEASLPEGQPVIEPPPPPPELLPTELSPDGSEPSQEMLSRVGPAEEPSSTPALNEQAGKTQADDQIYRTGSYQDWPAILTTTGELIGAVERAVAATGSNFISLFETVRLELADDYIFLDPMVKTFHYSSGVASLKNKPAVSVFVSGVSEALRRAVDRVAVGDRARRVRERVALEILSVARQRSDVLERSGLRGQLDRIAGTLVI